MPQTEIKNHRKELPATESSWVAALPEIFGEKWKQAGMREGMQFGIEEKPDYHQNLYSKGGEN